MATVKKKQLPQGAVLDKEINQALQQIFNPASPGNTNFQEIKLSPDGGVSAKLFDDRTNVVSTPGAGALPDIPIANLDLQESSVNRTADGGAVPLLAPSGDGQLPGQAPSIPNVPIPEASITPPNAIDAITPRPIDTSVPNVVPDQLTPVQEQNAVGFFDKPFFDSPQFPLVLAQLAKAFSASDPSSPQFQIGSVIEQRSRSQLSSKLLTGLTQAAVSGQDVDPATILSSGEIAALPPEMIAQAVQFAESAKNANLTQVNKALQTKIQGLNAQTSAARTQSTIDLNDTKNTKILEDIKRLDDPQSGDIQVVELERNLETGERTSGEFNSFAYDKIRNRLVGIGPSDKSRGSAGSKRTDTPGSILAIQKDVITQFGADIFEGLKVAQNTKSPSIDGKKIVDVAQMLRLLSNPLSGFDMVAAKSALSNVPNAFQEFNERVERASLDIDAGTNRATAINKVQENISRGPADIGFPLGDK